jgi:hypothetical protein
MPDVTICADPGVNGGFAVASGDVVELHAMPGTEKEIVELLSYWIRPSMRTRLFIEHVSGFIGAAHPGSRMFTFGENFGFIKGWAAGVGIPYELVGPFQWQQRLGIGLRSEREDSPQWKRALKGEALRRFPELKSSITLKTADALLIWDFVRLHRPWRKEKREEYVNAANRDQGGC